MKRIILAALAAAVLSGCSSAKVVATSNERMVVTDRKSQPKRFWVSLTDAQGHRWNEIRFSGKRCRNGPSRLRRGQQVMVRVERLQDDEGRETRRIDTGDLNRQFC